MAELVEQAHLLLAVDADLVPFGQVLDQLLDARPQLVGELRRGRGDERVDVVLARVRHQSEPNG